MHIEIHHETHTYERKDLFECRVIYFCLNYDFIEQQQFYYIQQLNWTLENFTNFISILWYQFNISHL